uniref:Uncharacterized protein n=1 Tax=Arundo donax TaxID=35708 RepID=A0A0A9G9Y8_ARUDO
MFLTVAHFLEDNCLPCRHL